MSLHNDGKVTVTQEFKDLLTCEAGKHHSPLGSTFLLPAQSKAAKELREKTDIVICKADKSNIYVILNKADHYDKLNKLNHETKFQEIRRDPTESLQRDVNNLIKQANAASA